MYRHRQKRHYNKSIKNIYIYITKVPPDKTTKAALVYIKETKICIRGVPVDYIHIIEYWE